MSQHLAELGGAIRAAILKISPPEESERPLTKEIYRALQQATRGILVKRFGGPLSCRYSGCASDTWKRYSQKPRKVLEYLWDFSFSRFAIPQAIEQIGTLPLSGKFELLFVVESELGTADEICRDLLKLLEARTAVRCLVYKQPKQLPRRQHLQNRMIRVMHNHAHFKPRSEEWLFVGLTWAQRHIDCDIYALNNSGTKLVPLNPRPTS
jgi:hypothetical protein